MCGNMQHFIYGKRFQTARRRNCSSGRAQALRSILMMRRAMEAPLRKKNKAPRALLPIVLFPIFFFPTTRTPGHPHHRHQPPPAHMSPAAPAAPLAMRVPLMRSTAASLPLLLSLFLLHTSISFSGSMLLCSVFFAGSGLIGSWKQDPFLLQPVIAGAGTITVLLEPGGARAGTHI